MVGAIRLPDNVFKESANTEVVTDILFFQKGSKNGKCVFLLEHQSTKDVNITTRMALYYLEILSQYTFDNKTDLHIKTQELKVPKAEFLVAYNGVL